MFYLRLRANSKMVLFRHKFIKECISTLVEQMFINRLTVPPNENYLRTPIIRV